MERSASAIELGFRQNLNRRLDPHACLPLVVALSGGGDSIALLRLTAAWAEARGRPLLAVTVDHGLHPDSAAWTDFAGAQARAFGCAWRGVRWTGPKPAAGLPAAARAARHALLAEAARAAGACVVLLGHTADDVIEGEWMRTHAALTLGRLRPWAPSPAWPQGRGVFLLRPLLHTRRADLRAWLAAEGAAWLDDPANHDPQFARARARARLVSFPDAAESELVPGVPPDGATLSTPFLPPEFPCQAIEDAGVLVLERRGLSGSVLAAALLCAAGTARPPRSGDLARLLARVRDGAPFTATLAGARIELCGEVVRIMREPGERARGGLATLPLPPGAPVVWDGRFEATAHAPGLTVVALAGRAARLTNPERAALAPLAPAARAALPALSDAEGGIALAPPFGAAPATVRSLVGERFEAALGLIADERAAASRAHGAAASLTLC